jgi:putative lipoprotein
LRQFFALSLGLNLVFAQSAATGDSWFGIDKLKHFFLSAFATSVSFSALQAAGANRNTAMAGAIGASAALGISRELYNLRTTKVFSLKDLTWDAIGTGAAATILSRTAK